MSMKPIEEIAGAIAEECVAVQMKAVARVVTKIYDDALRPLGLRVTQMNILVAAGKMGIAHPAPICRSLHLDASTLSRNVDRMKAKGWIEPVAVEDGRSQPFRLTASGESLLRAARVPWRRAQRRTRALLGDAFLDGLETAVKRLSREAAER